MTWGGIRSSGVGWAVLDKGRTAYVTKVIAYVCLPETLAI
jgi:hypothetical protein